MTRFHDTSVLGVDGGGTQCRFALVCNGARIEVVRQAANVSTDRVGAIAVLKDGFAELAQAAGLAVAEIQMFPAYLGLAGMLDARQGRKILADVGLENARIGDDRRTAMVGALGRHDGCVMGLGTGSFFGRRHKGVDHLVGGWGFALADEASGAALGRQLLRATLAAQDGMIKPTSITEACLARLGSPAAIVAFANEALPRDFAALAPQIVDAASVGDPVATRLMTSGATEIERTLRTIGWTGSERICCLGGLAPHYASYFSDDITACLRTPEGTALDGSLTLAAEDVSEGALA